MLAISQNAQISARACNGTEQTNEKECCARASLALTGAGGRRHEATLATGGGGITVLCADRAATERVTLYDDSAPGDNLANYR